MPCSTETPRLGHHAGTTSTTTLRTCLFCVNRPFVNRRTRGRCLVPERLFENVLDLALNAALEKALFELVGVRGGERELFVRARLTRIKQHRHDGE